MCGSESHCGKRGSSSRSSFTPVHTSIYTPTFPHVHSPHTSTAPHARLRLPGVPPCQFPQFPFVCYTPLYPTHLHRPTCTPAAARSSPMPVPSISFWLRGLTYATTRSVRHPRLSSAVCRKVWGGERVWEYGSRGSRAPSAKKCGSVCEMVWHPPCSHDVCTVSHFFCVARIRGLQSSPHFGAVQLHRNAED